MATLTTTSYAVLGLLDLQPWTAYELAGEMRHCFGAFWARADSRTYAEADRLVDHGLARARREVIGRRPRTTYSITAKGRRALRRWLADPSFTPFTLEFEGLVRVFLARSAGRDELVANLEQIASQAEGILAFAEGAAEQYYTCRAPFQREQAHLRAFVFTVMVPFARLMRSWAREAQAEVATWSDLAPPHSSDGPIERIRAAFEPAT